MILKQISPAKTQPNDIARAMTGRPYISHSEIVAFQSCPLKWHFSYVEHVQPELLSASMLVGSCTHAAIQRHLEATIAADTPPTVEQMMEAYDQSWKVEAEQVPEIQYPKGETADSLRATAQQMVETYAASPFAAPEGELIGIEETLNVKLGDDLPDLCGRVDLIEHRPESCELVITDYKTTRSMWSAETAEEHAQQLILYAHAAAPLARELGAKIRLQFVVITKGKTPKIDALPVQVNHDRIARTRTVVKRVFLAMQQNVIYPSPSPMNCHSCPFQKRCDKWHVTADDLSAA